LSRKNWAPARRSSSLPGMSEPRSPLHLYERAGDGMALIDQSPHFRTTRFIWLPDDLGLPPFRRYGNEADYPKEADFGDVLSWIRQQPWTRAEHYQA
jgi:hypothetical protein